MLFPNAQCLFDSLSMPSGRTDISQILRSYDMKVTSLPQANAMTKLKWTHKNHYL